MKVFCFAHAGGTAAAFGRLIQRLDACELVPMERPGHGHRIREPRLKSMKEYASDAVEQISPYLHEPFCLLGHSMGAWLAYEVAVALEQEEFPGPALLIVAGNTMPRSAPSADPVANLDEDAFLRKIADYAQIPSQVLRRHDLREIFYEPLRADYQILDEYACRDARVLRCPIIALFGDNDPLTAISGSGWRTMTSAHYEEHTFAGGHFFLYEDAEVPDRLAGWVTRDYQNCSLT